MLFWKILAKCLSKKGRNLFCLSWNYSNTPWRSSITSSLRSARFYFVYYVIFSCTSCCPFFIFWFYYFILYFLGMQRRLGYAFLKTLSKMQFKKGQKSLLFCLKLFEHPLMKFNNFKPSDYKFFHFGLFWFKFCSFLLARYLIWRYFSLGSIWNFIFTFKLFKLHMCL